jgi:AraC-like DNA-binding protein/quercetin dioxygenase-like cupin family protein
MAMSNHTAGARHRDHGEHVEHRRVTVLAPMDAVCATYRTHRFAPHMHEEFVIGLVERGACQFEYRGDRHTVRAGQVFVIAPGESHTGEAAHPDGWTYRAIYPASALLASAVGQPGGPDAVEPGALPAVVDDPVIGHALATLSRLIFSGASGEACEPGLASIFAHLAMRHAFARVATPHSTRAASRAVSVAREYIEAHATSVVRLATLAELTGLNAFSLIRAFRAAVGVPPYAYLTHVRLVRAVQLLRDGLPVSRVAYVSGFSDQSHFTRRFKSALGMPPGQYARGLPRSARDARRFQLVSAS